jgi:hypothetical protein
MVVVHAQAYFFFTISYLIPVPPANDNYYPLAATECWQGCLFRHATMNITCIYIQENRVMMLNNWIIICCEPYGLTTIFKDKTAAVLLHVTTVAKEAMRLCQVVVVVDMSCLSRPSWYF